MTTERIDRLEALAETILLAVQHQQAESREQRSLIEQMQREMRDSISDVVSMVGTLATEMHNMQSEIRGLQLENRRMLDAWINRPNQDGE